MKTAIAAIASVAVAEVYRTPPPGYSSGSISLADQEWGGFGFDFSVGVNNNAAWDAVYGTPRVRVHVTKSSTGGSGFLYDVGYSSWTSSMTYTSTSSYIHDFNVDGDDFYYCGAADSATNEFSILAECTASNLCISTVEFNAQFSYFYLNAADVSSTSDFWGAACRDYDVQFPLAHVRELYKESQGLLASEFGSSDLLAGSMGISTKLDRSGDEYGDIYFSSNVAVSGLASTKLLVCFSSDTITWTTSSNGTTTFTSLGPILDYGGVSTPVVEGAPLRAICDLGCYPNDDCSFTSLASGNLAGNYAVTPNVFYATTIVAGASQNVDGDHSMAFAFGHLPASAAGLQVSLLAVFAALVSLA